MELILRTDGYGTGTVATVVTVVVATVVAGVATVVVVATMMVDCKCTPYKNTYK